MPLIAYQRAHGTTDFPHHYAFFEALEQRGLLEKFDFAIDPSMDLGYCLKLLKRFPQLQLTGDASTAQRVRLFLERTKLRGAGISAKFDTRFDAVCEAPGGRIQPVYSYGQDIFWAYPRVKRRAILFHSVEEGILSQPKTRRSVAEAELVITRTDASAAVAARAGVPDNRIVRACDIVFRHQSSSTRPVPGVAVALRLPGKTATPDYVAELRRVMDYLETLDCAVDHVRIEEPLGAEQIRRGYGSHEIPNVRMWYDDFMYVPFHSRRDALISSRLHTTIIGLLSGNRAIMQFHVEPGTSKLQQFVDDLELHELKVRTGDDLKVEVVRDFIATPTLLSEAMVENALAIARRKVELGLDRFEEWLRTL